MWIYNLLPTLATIFVAIIAWRIYLCQRYESKRDAASILLNEIRNAERAIDGIVQSGSITNVFVLPENSWYKYRHIFVRDFDSDEMELINTFYSRVEVCERLVRDLNNALPDQIKGKAVAIQNQLVRIAYENIDNEKQYQEQKNKLLKIVGKEGYWFVPDDPQIRLREYIAKIPKVTITSAGQKLKDIQGKLGGR